MIYTITPTQIYSATVFETVYCAVFDLAYPDKSFLRVTTNGLPTESSMILLQKGVGFTADYAASYFPVLDANWTGSVSFYTEYPGTPTFTKALTLAGNVLTLSLTVAEVINLADGVYSFVTTIANAPLGIETVKLEYATVSAVNISAATKCKLFGIILKADGTPAGEEGRLLSNTVNGVTLALRWAGVMVTVSSPIADANSGDIIGVEKLKTTTNAVGYFEQYVIQGLTVTVTCPAFGKSVTVDTTGLDAIDLSTFF